MKLITLLVIMQTVMKDGVPCLRRKRGPVAFAKRHE
jgi:hypothetical protein